MVKQLSNNKEFIFTGIYNVADKYRRLSYLHQILDYVSTFPTLVMGDLSLLFERQDKRGGTWDDSFYLQLFYQGFPHKPISPSIEQHRMDLIRYYYGTDIATTYGTTAISPPPTYHVLLWGCIILTQPTPISY